MYSIYIDFFLKRNRNKPDSNGFFILLNASPDLVGMRTRVLMHFVTYCGGFRNKFVFNMVRLPKPGRPL